MNRRVLLAVGFALLLAGCKKRAQPDIEPYPGAMQRQGGTTDLGGATLFHQRAVTPDALPQIRAHYDAQLRSRPGWTLQDNGFGELVVWTDGGLKGDASGQYLPADPAVPGGRVEVLVGGGQTIIETWQSVPNPK